MSQTAKQLVAALLLVAFPSPAAAQARDPVAPNAGSVLQQVQPVPHPPPAASGGGLTIDRAGEPVFPASAPFMVATIQISGNTLFDTAILHALVADAEGKSLTLSQLGEKIDGITDHYRSHGYPLAQAIIPAQVIRDGRVVVEVIEARYDKITLDNRSRVKDPLLQDTLSPLQSGQAIGQTELDHALLLLSDIPGVVINATLRPGEAVGTSDLLVDTTAGPAISGYAALDNYGSRFTGRPRLGGTVNVINPLRHGDVLSASGLTSGRGVNYGRISYESLLNGWGTRVGGSYSALRYEVGGSLASLDAHGTAQVVSLWTEHPLVRSRDVSLYGQIQYDRLQLRDHIDVGAIQIDRHLDTLTLSLAGEGRDAFLSGGINTWGLGWTWGFLGFDDEAAELADAATARTRGGFSKWTASISRLQRLTSDTGLYLSFSGQWANANLDLSEKMIAGGPYTVRAYDIGSVSGDTMYHGTAELRHDLGSAWKGRWQAIAFVDTAHVTLNETAWAAGTNSATLNGAGIGLNWAGPKQLNVRAYVATRIGPVPEVVGSNESIRGSAEISMGF